MTDTGAVCPNKAAARKGDLLIEPRRSKMSRCLEAWADPRVPHEDGSSARAHTAPCTRPFDPRRGGAKGCAARQIRVLEAKAQASEPRERTLCQRGTQLTKPGETLKLFRGHTKSPTNTLPLRLPPPPPLAAATACRHAVRHRIDDARAAQSACELEGGDGAIVHATCGSYVENIRPEHLSIQHARPATAPDQTQSGLQPRPASAN